MGIRGKETIQIERRAWGPEDEFGNPTFETTILIIKGCLVAWGATGETGDLFGLNISTHATIQLPKGTLIHKNDVFTLSNGQRYVLNGEPLRWVPQAASPVKPKVLVNVVLKDGGSDG